MTAIRSTNAQHAPRSDMLIFIIIALAASSLEPVIIKLGYGLSATALELFFVKSMVGGIVILPLTRSLGRISLGLAAKILSASILFMGSTALVFAALNHLPVVIVITIMTTAPALVAIINSRRGHDVLERGFWFGFGLCLAGIALAVDLPGNANNLTVGVVGIACSGGATLAAALYRIRMAEITAELQPRTASTYLFLMNAALALMLVPWLDRFPVGALAPGAWLGCAGAVANIAFLIALRIIGATRLSIIMLLQRPLVIVAGALILHERLSALQLVGVVMVLVGIYAAKVTRTHKQPYDGISPTRLDETSPGTVI